jgi:hypothetical protein
MKKFTQTWWSVWQWVEKFSPSVHGMGLLEKTMQE